MQPFVLNRRERSLPSSEVYDSAKLFTQWKEQMQSQPGLHFLLDLDENLFNTVDYWIRLTNHLLHHKYGVPQSFLPSQATVLQAGGPSQYYFRAFPEYFPSYESYDILADELRHRYWPNQAGPLMVENLDEIFDLLSQEGNVLGGLTARPASTDVLLATQQQFSRALTRHPIPEVMYKPLFVAVQGASQEKLAVLRQLAGASADSVPVLIDDSLSTAQVLSQHNKEQPHLPIMQILNGEGPFTRGKLAHEPDLVNDLRGVFVMPHWEDLRGTIEKGKSWLKHLR